MRPVLPFAGTDRDCHVINGSVTVCAVPVPHGGHKQHTRKWPTVERTTAADKCAKHCKVDFMPHEDDDFQSQCCCNLSVFRPSFKALDANSVCIRLRV